MTSNQKSFSGATGVTSAPKRAKLIDSDEENEPQEYEQANAEANKTIVDGESSDEGVNKDDDNNANIGYACIVLEYMKTRVIILGIFDFL